MRMSKRKRRARIYSPRVWGTWILVAFGWVCARLPLPLLVSIGKGLGIVAYHVARQRRHITEVNLGLCFPELPPAERQRLSRASFVHTGVSLSETMVSWLNPAKPVYRRFRIEGLEYLEAAQRQGRGVVLVGAHFSCLDFGSQALSRAIDVDVMYRANKNPVWEWLQVRGRRHYFDGVIERTDTRQTLRRLKAGRIIWYAADQDYGRRHSVFAPFFGIPTATITATARLARFNDSPVLFIIQSRDLETLTWEIRLSPPLQEFPGGDDVADATRVNAVIEAAIREHPEQYLWVHRRFKTRPEGESRPY